MTTLTKAQIEAMLADGGAAGPSYTFAVETVKFKPYKPDGARQMGRKGRWQKMVWRGDFFDWQNCDDPTRTFAAPPDFEATARTAIALHNRVAELEGALRDARDLSQTANSDDVYAHCIATLERTTP